MDDNYYKKGKDNKRREAAQEQQQQRAQLKGRARTQLNRHSLKTNYHELGKGRIVESSQSGFACTAQQSSTSQPAEQINDQNDKVTDEEVAASNPSPIPGPDKIMSANSNGQRRGARNSHDHFATLHQTPQPVIQASSGSGHSTPLTHLIQRRQFEMTQLPKSNSTGSEVHQPQQQPHVMTMNLQNPKMITSAQKKIASIHNAHTDLYLDKNMSTLSGGHLNTHSRRVSSNSKPMVSKPQGGVFQSGPSSSKLKAGGPSDILTNNFMGANPSSIVAESPQFVLHANDRFNFGSQTESTGHIAKSAAATFTTDQLKNEQQQSQSTGSKSKKFNNTAGVATLTLNQQPSGVALQTVHASHFNTPSNCYQAQQQHQGNNIFSNNEAYQRPSLPMPKDPMGAHTTSTDQNMHHLSQNSYEMTAPLHISTSHTPVGTGCIGNRHASNASLIGNSAASLLHIGNYNPLHQHSNSTLIANLAQAQNTSAQNLPQHQTTANNNSHVVNFTQHTQQAHPNLHQAVPLLHQQMNSNNAHQPLNGVAGAAASNTKDPAGQGHLSVSQFDISALLRQQPSTTAQQAVFDFQELCSNTTHHAGHQTQTALKMSVEATTRDIDFLKQRFYAEYGCDTNDILTLYSFWHQNFQSFGQVGVGGSATNGNQTTAINALQIANMSSYRHNPQHHHTITGPTSKSNNVTALGVSKQSVRHTTVNQHQTINFNSQSFENQTMTTSHIQPRKVTKLLEHLNVAPGGQASQHKQTILQVKDGGVGGQDSTEIQHYTAGSVGVGGYTPFDVNQQMYFVAPNPSQPMTELQQVKGRRTQPCIRQHSTVSNRQNCTDTVSFHRDVPTPMMQQDALASAEAEDEKNEFSFEEPAIDGTNEQSIEEEEKSLINALSFKKQIAPLADGQNLHEIENQRGWATTKQDTTPSLPKYRNGQRPHSKDQCGFTIQLSPINRFAPSSRSKRSVFDFYGAKCSRNSMLLKGIRSAKRRIKKKGSTNKDGARKFLHRHLQAQSKTLSSMIRGQTLELSPVFKLKSALEVIFSHGRAGFASQDYFRRMLPRRRDFDSNDNKTTCTNRGDDKNQSDLKRRREKSTKGRGTSKSRKRQGSRNSRRQRLASLYRESTSSIGDESASLPIFTHMSKEANQDDFINVIRPAGEVVHDAETTQDIQKLCKEIEDAEKNFADKLNQDEDQFDKQMTQQVVQAERALQESKRESQTRELSMRGTRRESQLNLADRNNFKAQSLSSLNQAMMPLGIANATQRHLNPCELYGTEGKNMAQYAQTNDPAAPNTERPNAQSIEMRLALHHQTQMQRKKGDANTSSHDADTTKPMVRVQPKSQAKGRRINVVSLLDQKSEPCLLKPKKMSLDRQQVKLLGANDKVQSAQKQIEVQKLDGEADENSKTPNDRKTGTNIQSQNTLQSSNSMNSKRRLTFIKTKNINFHTLSKLSGRMQASATSTHQAAPGLKIKLQTANGGESTERSGNLGGGTGDQMRFTMVGSTTQGTSCQSALAMHKHTGKMTGEIVAPKSINDLIRMQSNSNSNTVMIKHVRPVGDQSDRGITPDKPTGMVKYASARIKLVRQGDEDNKSQLEGQSASVAQNTDQQASNIQEGPGNASPTSSAHSTLGGSRHMRRLVEMLINEFYRKRGQSIKTVSREKQVETLVEFWRQSLSQQKILGKLKGKLAKTGLVEKEKHLMNYLNGKDRQSLFNLQKHSTTRKYGELAVVEDQVLRWALDEYLSKSQ